MSTTRQLRRIALNEIEAVTAQAEADRHATLAPTHVMVKNGRIVGAASIGAIVLVLPWFSTQECKARDSLFYIGEMERFIARTVPPEFPGLICVPFVPTSKFHPYVSRLGYHSAGLVDLTFKQLKAS